MAEDKAPKKQHCRKCGAEFSSPAQMKRISDKLETTPECLSYCPVCKRARLAEFMAKSVTEEE